MKSLKEISKLTDLQFNVEELDTDHVYLILTDAPENTKWERYGEQVVQLSRVFERAGIKAIIIDKSMLGELSIYELMKETDNGVDL